MSQNTSPNAEGEICILGRIGAAHGVKGWSHVQSFTDDPADILGYKTWLIQHNDNWVEYKIESKRSDGNKIAVKLAGINDRATAHTLRGSEIGIPEAQLPKLAQNEFYWRDLIGMNVVTVEGEALGTITSFFATGANDVMVVSGANEPEQLIPYAASVVKTVSVVDKRMTVDWDIDY